MVAGEHGNQRHKTALMRARIVELRDQQMTFREIAAEVDLSLARVWQHYQAAMREIPAAAVTAHAERVAARREEQLRRIDMERESVLAVLEARHVIVSNGKVMYEGSEPLLDDAPVLAAVDRLVKLDDQEAKLLGMYPKTEVNVSGGVEYVVRGLAGEDLK